MAPVEHGLWGRRRVLARRAGAAGSSGFSWNLIGVMFALAILPGCVSVHYQRPGSQISPRTGETLVFGRVRFFHDGREYFPWDVNLMAPPVGTDTERHLWLLRLGRRAVSAELHPDPDGSLAIWLSPGDYALLGAAEISTVGAPPYEVVALVRVPVGAVAAYAGDLNLKTESHDGGHLSYRELGAASVTLVPVPLARATLEQRLGGLPDTPVLSAWCASEQVPDFNDASLAGRAKELLDDSCAATSRPLLGSAPVDTGNPTRIPLYGTGDTAVGHVILGRSTSTEARRVLESQGGLGPARDNEVTFRIGSASLHPQVVYTPPGTMHQLYFKKDTLVLVVTGVLHNFPSTRLGFVRRFSEARESHREEAWYEMQARLSECVWLIAVFGTGTDSLESYGHAWTCGAA